MWIPGAPPLMSEGPSTEPSQVVDSDTSKLAMFLAGLPIFKLQHTPQPDMKGLPIYRTQYTHIQPVGKVVDV